MFTYIHSLNVVSVHWTIQEISGVNRKVILHAILMGQIEIVHMQCLLFCVITGLCEEAGHHLCSHVTQKVSVGKCIFQSIRHCKMEMCY